MLGRAIILSELTGKKSPWICMEHVLKLVRVDVQVLRSPCGSSDEMMVAWTKIVVERWKEMGGSESYLGGESNNLDIILAFPFTIFHIQTSSLILSLQCIRNPFISVHLHFYIFV